MATGLNVADFVQVTTLIEPAAAQYRNFGIGLILGSTPNVIDVATLLRPYTTLEAIAADFGTTAPEYLAADLYFSQQPQPAICYVGYWPQYATAGLLHGATLSPAQALLSSFTNITNGSFHAAIDGTGHDFTGINLSGALNLNGVANLVQAAITAVVPGVVVRWDSVLRRFTIISGTTGIASSVSFGTPAASGTDLSAPMHLTAFDASAPVIGVAPQTLVDCVANLADVSNAWYSVQVATVTPPTDADILATAQLIEGLSASQSRIFGVSLSNANALDSTSTSDLGSELQALGLGRTYDQFSFSSPYVASSLFGRAATVDFEGSNTTITLAYKQEPGVVAENLTEGQFRTLMSKNINVFTKVNNKTAIVFPGKMTNGDYFDERHNLDWLQNRIQVDVYNLLYETPTKIPQTDAGMTKIANRIKKSCEVGVTNGMLSEGIWLGPTIGPIDTGDNLPKGYYVHYLSVSTQSEADRYARKSVLFQVLLKAAGAVHIVNIAALLDR